MWCYRLRAVNIRLFIHLLSYYIGRVNRKKDREGKKKVVGGGGGVRCLAEQRRITRPFRVRGLLSVLRITHDALSVGARFTQHTRSWRGAGGWWMASSLVESPWKPDTRRATGENRRRRSRYYLKKERKKKKNVNSEEILWFYCYDDVSRFSHRPQWYHRHQSEETKTNTRPTKILLTENVWYLYDLPWGCQCTWKMTIE